MKKDKFIILHLILLFFFSTYNYGDIRISPFTNIFYLYLYGSTLVLIYLNGLIRRKIFVSKVPVLLFITICLLTVFITVYQGEVISTIALGLTQLVLLIYFYELFIFYNKNPLVYVNIFFKFLFVLSIISLFYALYGYIFGSFSFGPIIYYESSINRLDGWYGSSNRLGPVLAIGFLVSFYFIRKKYKSNHKWVLIILSTLLITGVLLTGSRGTWMGLILSVLLVLMLTYKNKSNRKKSYKYYIIPVLMIPSLLFSLLVYFDIDLNFIMEYLVRPEELEYQLEGERGGRVYYWLGGFNIFLNSDTLNQLFGNGIGYFNEVIGRSSHSGYITMLVDRGVISVMLLIFLVLYLIKIAKRYSYYLEYKLIMCVLIFIVIKNITNNDIPSNGYTGILFVFILFICSIKIENERNNRRT